jgi:predicted RNA-binding protein with RPS1 domain
MVVVEMTDKLRLKILEALEKLPPQAPIRQISEKVGTLLTVQDMRSLVHEGLVGESEAIKPPVIRFDLVAAGRKWLDHQRTGAVPATKGKARPSDGPLLDTLDQAAVEQLHRRFDAGEGQTPASRLQLAAELGVDEALIRSHLGGWKSKKRTADQLAQMAAAAKAPAAPPEAEQGASGTEGIPVDMVAYVPAENSTGEHQADAQVVTDSTSVSPAEHPGTSNEPAGALGDAGAPAAKRRLKHEDVAKLYARFAAGEGTKAESKAALAAEFGLVISSINKHLTRWRQKTADEAKSAPVPEVAPIVETGSGKPDSTPNSPSPRRLDPEVVQRLYARFDAGEGTNPESRLAISNEMGIRVSTVDYHHKVWGRRPKAEAAGPGPIIEHQPAPAQEAGTVEVIDGAGTIGEIEHPAASADPAEDEGSKADAPGIMEDPFADESTIAEPSSSTETALSSSPVATPSTPEPKTAMAAALMKAGLVKPEDAAAVLPDKSARRLTCQGCRRPVESLLWHTDPTTGRSGHKECVTPLAVAPRPDEEEVKLPEVGEICEGVVYTVEATAGTYVLVDLTKYSRPDERQWVRGKVTRAQVLRRGWCEDAHDWLRPGDLVNVQVLDVTPGRGSQKPRLNLSIKQAPAHEHERIRLEVASPVQPEEPISVRGSEVADLIGTAAAPAPTAEERREAIRLARDLMRQFRLHADRLDELVERILANGISQTTEELEALNMAQVNTASAAAPVPEIGSEPAKVHTLEVSATPEWLARQEKLAALEELAAARAQVQQLEAEVAAARHEREVVVSSNHRLEAELAGAMDKATQAEANAQMAVDVNRQLRQDLTRAQAEALTSEMQALASARELQAAESRKQGICSSCVHRIDGFCPYPDVLADTYQLPEEDLSSRHKTARIVFGKCPVIECSLYRPVMNQADTAAD